MVLDRVQILLLHLLEVLYIFCEKLIIMLTDGAVWILLFEIVFILAVGYVWGYINGMNRKESSKRKLA